MNDPKRPDDRNEAGSGAGGGAARDAREAGGRRADSRGDPRGDHRRAGAAWRSLSNEEPPAALDAALRAAARREVGARVKPAAVPEATRPERWWFPLAAAATIGAIAIGLLQVVMPERMGEPGGDARSVSDIPPGASGVPGTTGTSASKAESPSPARLQQERKGAERTPEAEPGATAGAAQAVPSPTTGGTDAASRVTASTPSPAKVEAQAPPRVVANVASSAAIPPASPAATASAESARRDRTPQPFPADAEKPQSDPATPPAPRAVPLAGAPAPPSAAAPAPPPVAAPAAPPTAARSAPASLAPPPAPPAAAPTAKLGAAREQSDRAIAPRAADLAEGAAGANRARGEIGQRAAELPVPEWIALIRRLRDDGKLADVDRELKAFRAAHPDHLTLLPPDLRDWRLPP